MIEHSNDCLNDFRWLVSSDAAPWLELADQQPQSVALAERLRRELTPERAGLVIEQVELRRRATRKFSRAREMFFTRRALEQASDECVAHYKAQRVRAAHIVDGCCGIGGDLFALAARGSSLLAIDRDPTVIVLARANAAIHAIDNVDFQIADVSEFQIAGNAFLHLDPDRRSTGKRVTSLLACEPNGDTIQRLTREARGAAVKLAPAADVPDDWAALGEREWIQSGAECRQQVLWLGDAVRDAGRRTAAIIDDAGRCAAHVTGHGTSESQIAPQPLEFVYDPAAAVLAAGLLDDLSQRYGVARVASGSVYLTSAARVDCAFLAAFRVKDVIPFDLKRLKQYVRQHQLGRLEIKKRGVDVQPDKLMRQLKTRGDHSATLLITRLARGVVAVVAERCR